MLHAIQLSFCLSEPEDEDCSEDWTLKDGSELCIEGLQCLYPLVMLVSIHWPSGYNMLLPC